jgi:phosphoribosylformylglycinamidine synthase II
MKKTPKDLKPRPRPGDPEVTPKLAASYGLNAVEYKKVLGIMGRLPTHTELGIFSVMWSEHCSYKTSKPHLKGFPTKGKRVMQGPGENAGVLDIGGGWATAFKIESHNHPSAVEPYQGAATGVGGILRDVFTMGARPIANLNSLRFGPLKDPHVQRLVKGVVAGIGGYGNCVGIPTVGGEVVFDPCYRDNCLVNAFALGVLPHKRLIKGKASGVGNPVMYIGSTTGRDGIHGATFASVDLSSETEEKRSAVQVGDPFMEKLLLEATLELIESGHLVGIQDMGAAGMTSSSVEMAFRGGAGIDVHVDKVPRRESGMVPYEVMLSESQERMLLVCKKGREKYVERILGKWGLHASVVGQVTNSGRHRIYDQGVLVSDLPIEALADDHHPDFPLYHRPMAKPAYLKKTAKLSLKSLKAPKDLGAVLLKLLASPSLADKQWVFRQYDHQVRTNTLVKPGSDAAVVRVKENGKGLAMAVDGNGRYCYLSPREGGRLVVAEACRNVAVSGAEPIGLSDCLNFGNPEKPEIMWQFSEVVKGMAEAARALGVPVISGNVSLYNQGPSGAIDPTPVVAAVGLLEPVQGKLRPVPQWFQAEGDLVYLAGSTREEVGGSEYLQVVHGLKKGLPPKLDLKAEARLQKLCVQLARKGIVRSAHDLSDGGLAVAAAESCISGRRHGAGPLGASLSLKAKGRPDALLFGESASRVLFSVAPGQAKKLEAAAKAAGVPLQALGAVGGSRLTLDCNGQSLNLGVAELEHAFTHAFDVLDKS